MNDAGTEDAGSADRELTEDRTDWERLRAMSDEELLANALSDPDAQPLSEQELAEMQPGPVAKRLRLAMGLTQKAFAERFGLSASVVRDWEQHRSKPDRAARVLLRVIEFYPDVVAQALASDAPRPVRRRESVLVQLSSIAPRAVA